MRPRIERVGGLSTRRSFRIDDIATRLEGRLVGDGAKAVSGVASLSDAGPDDLSFYTGGAYRSALARTRAGALLTHEIQRELTIPQVVVADPYM